MSYDIPTTEPDKVTAGDSWQWTKAISAYPASVWTLTYSLVNAAGRIVITATADGDTHVIDEAAADTASETAGTYDWQSYVTNGTERHTLETSTIEVVANYAAASSGLDARTHVKTTLDALRATIEGKATGDQLAMSVGGHSISRYSPAELITWFKQYKAMYTDETRQARVDRGLGHNGKMRIRFTD